MRAGVLWNDRPCLSRYGQAAAAQGVRRSGKDRQRGMCGVLPFIFLSAGVFTGCSVQNGQSNIAVFVRNVLWRTG